ncbi:MAG: flagellar basal body L-ring protein FlgH [Marivibrio sp.]|uniref:flagellar basal body L-ring protein FlgH n=1 Tax=Marivibrio sp. TaxID=2039719 RepID=UPI0032EAEF33
MSPSFRLSREALLRAGAVATIALSLGACNTLERLTKVGEEPGMAEIANPTHQPGYKPVSMPMPQPMTATREPNSLWRAGSRAFFKDLRASQIGDIVTVVISIDENAEMSNTTTRTRNTSENVDLDALLGYGAALDTILPEAVNPADILAFDGQTNNTGGGSIDREEEIELQIAAVVTQVLPNGNLVLHGRQETRVNFEVRELQIAGIIRPQDITNQNTVSYEKIAEARLAYGGRGHITDFNQPRWGTQLVDVLMPF